MYFYDTTGCTESAFCVMDSAWNGVCLFPHSGCYRFDAQCVSAIQIDRNTAPCMAQTSGAFKILRSIISLPEGGCSVIEHLSPSLSDLIEYRCSICFRFLKQCLLHILCIARMYSSCSGASADRESVSSRKIGSASSNGVHS